MKRFISIMLSISLICCSVIFTSAEVFAGIKDGVLSTVAGISSIPSALASCEHNYVITNFSTASCTRKAYVTQACTYCGATRRQYIALGHYYEPSGEVYRGVTFKCKYCTSTISKSVEDMLAVFYSNINATTIRNNSNCFADVVCDGVINAKDFDYLEMLSPYKLTNPNANAQTQAIYQYLCEVNGNQTISAQQESTWMGSPDYEINYVKNTSGKYPAIRGLDYMNDDFKGVNKRAIAYWNAGGLVTICWHCSQDFDKGYNECKVVDDNGNRTSAAPTQEWWNEVLTEGTSENTAFIQKMDRAASALLELQNAGVTVLWRPFHEFDGNWFWWGSSDVESSRADNFIKLWQMMYDRYTNYWHLNNLIWVLGYCHNGVNMARWNPGEDYYDIIGADSYDKSELSTLYNNVKAIAGFGKPIALHECGENPTEAELNQYPWCYFMTWHTNYLTDSNTQDNIRTLYTTDRVITRDELPMFK